MSTSIELCSDNKVKKLLDFIDVHWAKNHIFVKQKELFDWQHKSLDGYNFVLACDSNSIVGALGFIPTSHFSSKLSTNKETWLAIWKVIDDPKYVGIGIGLLDFIATQFNFTTICSVGINTKVMKLYKALGFTIGELEHRAFFNQSFKDFNITSPPSNYKTIAKRSNVLFKELSNEDELKSCEQLFTSYPRKDTTYIINRYLRHPQYLYKCVKVYKAEKLFSLFIYRIISIKNAKIARIVDVQGGNILSSEFNTPFINFLTEQELEYVDIVSNLPASEHIGFKHNLSDNFIVPNYFEPFILSNVPIYYAYKSEKPITIFRGDSDQDRPNI